MPAKDQAPATTSQRDKNSGTTHQTVVALFDDLIDTQLYLQDLRKSGGQPSILSLILHHKQADQSGPSARPFAVAQAIDALDLGDVADWLCGVASVVVPERGTYLVAGPLGAALFGFGEPDHGDEAQPAMIARDEADEADLLPDGLINILVTFGFGDQEATYLEHRLMAGSILVGLTSNDTDFLETSRGTLAEHNAVHIGLANTDSGIARRAEAGLAAPLGSSNNGYALVTDSVTPLVNLCSPDAGEGSTVPSPHCGRKVVDRDGNECGSVVEILAEVTPDTAGEPPEPIIRYAVVGFGGVLGLGRRHLVVPAEQLDLSADPIVIATSKDTLQRAPLHDIDIPLSRREEQIIYGFFGTTPYWEAQE